MASPTKILHDRTTDNSASSSQPGDMQAIHKYLQQHQGKQKAAYNKRTQAKDIPDLSVGQPVFYISPDKNGEWLNGTISEICPEP